MDGTLYAELTDRSIPSLAINSTKKGVRPAKRAFDILSAAVLLAFVAPLMLILYVLVSLDGGPAIFAHRRVGEGGRIFRCLKFRSMYPDAAERLQDILLNDPQARAEWARDHKLRRDPRITPLGRFLRASSLDELPQLFNIIRGEMSVVGPRPIVQAEIVRYGARFESYRRMRPGLTGLWQVSGRNNVDYRRRVAMDVLYSRRNSFLLDMRIVAMTVPAVLLSRGSY
jgi:lipopolysaccharide/colanic/teichoic acid biosynthesis glycosyltransferase